MSSSYIISRLRAVTKRLNNILEELGECENEMEILASENNRLIEIRNFMQSIKAKPYYTRMDLVKLINVTNEMNARLEKKRTMSYKM